MSHLFANSNVIESATAQSYALQNASCIVNCSGVAGMSNKQGRTVKTIATKHGDIILDDDTYESLSDKVYIYPNRVAATGKRYVTITMSLSRFIMGMSIGDGKIVDHINGNPLDNRKENLRICESIENSQNRGKGKNTYSSKYKGVSRCKITWIEKGTGEKRHFYRWRAMIQQNGIPIRLGEYKTQEMAAYVYDYAAHKLYGEFARPNGLYIPPSPEQFGLRESA